MSDQVNATNLNPGDQPGNAQSRSRSGITGNQPSAPRNAMPTAPPLSGVVTTTRLALLPNAETYRKYVGLYTSVLSLKGVNEPSQKRIMYEIGRRDNDVGRLMSRVEDPELCSPQTVKVSPLTTSELVAFNKKYTNFSGVFEFMDFSAMAFLLAKALALYTVTGNISCAQIRGDHDVVIRVLGVRDDPVSVSDNCVFIPRHAALDHCPGAFYALAAAANGYGSSVLTDVLIVDGNGAPMLSEPNGNSLAHGIYGALRILLSMYHHSGHGPVLAYAIAKGIHDVVTVVGHTDEGGYIRRVMRRGGFRPSYGGVFTNTVASYVGLPSPTQLQPSTFQAIVDGIAVKSAALSALSDPMVLTAGRVYPTVFAVADTDRVPSGIHVEAPEGTSLVHARSIAEAAPLFCANYIANLGWLFNFNGGETGPAVSHLINQFSSMVGQHDRHLQHMSVAPFFWVEPTSLFKDLPPNDTATKHDYGVLALNQVETTKSMFESISVIQTTTFDSWVSHSWRSARTNPLIVHLNRNSLNGLAHIIPVQFASDSMQLVGGQNEPVVDRKNRAASLDEYLWGRGQSDLPAPAEAMYIGAAIGSRFCEGSWTLNGVLVSNHIPFITEMKSGTVKMSAASPSFVGSGPIGIFPRAVARARTSASDAITNARLGQSAFLFSGGETFSPSEIEPCIATAPAPVPIVDAANINTYAADTQLPTANVATRGAPISAVIMDQAARARPPPGTNVAHAQHQQLPVAAQAVVVNAPNVQPALQPGAGPGDQLANAGGDAEGNALGPLPPGQ